MKRNPFLYLFLALSMLLIGCEEDIGGLGPNSDDIIGSWNVEIVSGSGTVAGISQSDTDNNPSGTVEFKGTGLGETDYSYELFGRSENSNGGFSWKRENGEIEIFQGTGGAQDWEIVSESENRLEIEWSEVLDPTSSADFSMVLTR
ncbi:MAG: lipocalin family protein [Bacteroidota bacterium]